MKGMWTPENSLLHRDTVLTTEPTAMGLVNHRLKPPKGLAKQTHKTPNQKPTIFFFLYQLTMSGICQGDENLEDAPVLGGEEKLHILPLFPNH